MEEKSAFFKKIFDEMIPFHQFLGMKLLEVSDGFAKAIIPFRPDLVGDPRIQSLHGGVIATVMDAVGGVVGMTTLTSMEDKISTIDLRIDYLRSARNCDLIVEGILSRSGNRIVSVNMKAYKMDETDLIAEGKAVFNVIRKNDK